MESKLINLIGQYLQSIPVEKAWVFGSRARGTFTNESDIDLLVRFVQPNTIDLFDLAGYVVDLEEITQQRVDLVEEGYVKPFAKQSVEQDKVLIYERKAERSRTTTAHR